jgi:hypothetical protein
MASRITDAVIEATQQPRLKAYFLLRGDEYIKSNYEKLLIEQRDDVKLKAIANINYQYRETGVATDLNLSVRIYAKDLNLSLVLALKMNAIQSFSMDCEKSTAPRRSETSGMSR